MLLRCCYFADALNSQNADIQRIGKIGSSPSKATRRKQEFALLFSFSYLSDTQAVAKTPLLGFPAENLLFTRQSRADVQPNVQWGCNLQVQL